MWTYWSLRLVTSFTRGVCTSVPTFQNLAKHIKFQVKIVIAIDKIVGLPEWIIVLFHFMFYLQWMVLSAWWIRKDEMMNIRTFADLPINQIQ